MTVPLWPAQLRQFMSAPDFSTAPPDGRLRSPVDAGPAKLRRRVTVAIKPVSGSIRCDQDQMARLERFWLEDLRGGVLPFLFPDQVYNNALLCTEAGEPLLTEASDNLLVANWWLVQFAEPPPLRPLRRVTAHIVTLSFNVLV